MRIKSALISFVILCITLTFSGCRKDVFEPQKEDFEVKSFITNIKCYDLHAGYIDNYIPVNNSSSEEPFVSLQSWVIKGKDILMSITVPEDAEEIYFGAINPEEDYGGLHFEGKKQNSALGYYRLNLSEVNNPEKSTNGFVNYLVVLSSNENIQLNQFDLIVSYKDLEGMSNKSTVPIEVISIAPYQKNLKVGFRPLSGYTYSISIDTPTGAQIIYSYNKDTGNETFNNNQSPGSTLSYDPSLDIKWIDLDPQFGSYSVNATVQIELTGETQYIYMIFIIVTEGIIDQLSLDVDIYQTGQNTAVGTVDIGFSYFTEYENPPPNIIILNARMTSTSILGVDAKVWFPEIDPPDNSNKFVQLSGTINGISFIETIDVTNIVDPGEETLIEWVYSSTKLQVDFSNTHGIDGDEVVVTRFIDNEVFNLFAKAYSEKAGESISSSFEVNILLPTIIIHGVTTNLFEEMFSFVPYIGLQSFLEENGYDVDDSWYKTLWGPPDVKFSSQEDTPIEIATILTNWINNVINTTYADKVNIIGHSLGGMIGRYYITEHDHGNHVRRLILVGTPNNGSTHFYIKLYSNPPQWAEEKLHTSNGLPNCRNWLSSTYNTLYNSETGELIPNTHINLFHSENYNKPPPPGVRYFNIYNNSLSTVKTIYIKPIGNDWYDFVETKELSTGDITVISESSISYGENIGVSTSSGHALLPSDEVIMPIILNSLISNI